MTYCPRLTTGDHFEVANADLTVTSLGKRKEAMVVTETATGGSKTKTMKLIIADFDHPGTRTAATCFLASASPRRR